MAEKLSKWLRFMGGIVGDHRVPLRDKAIVGIMAFAIISPIDIIPDFIPGLGQIDDIAILFLIIDYVFNVIPFDVLADNYDGDPGDLRRIRRRSRFLSFLVPGRIKRRLWA